MEAVQKLHDKLMGFPWFISVGVGFNECDETLFVYVKSKNHPELKELGSTWMGIPINVRVIGTIKALKES